MLAKLEIKHFEKSILILNGIHGCCKQQRKPMLLEGDLPVTDMSSF